MNYDKSINVRILNTVDFDKCWLVIETKLIVLLKAVVYKNQNKNNDKNKFN